MKKFFQKIGLFLAAMFGNSRKFEKFLKDHADEGIEIVIKLQLFLNSGLVNTIIQILPPKYGNPAEGVLEKAQAVIDRVLLELGVVSGCLELENTVARLNCYLEFIKSLKSKSQNGELLKFASLYARYSSDTELKESVVDTIVQNRLLDKKNGISAAA